eukprot:TRINITY_DN4467_c0_g1_i1.p1 TRINITY_DN4467_c0_g1~~TRINITY_DN4467_c0_g1_i1.p1  ORF type:complete len:247 (-),score=43.17 TRINITY_DN4467_c0_g1_i1:205-834(-)
MFVIVIVEDHIVVHPSNFDHTVETIETELEKKYTNRVILNVGLGIALHDILEIGDANIYPADGSAHFQVKSRIVVFRPFVGEVLMGSVKSSTSEHIQLSLGFCDEIYVLPGNMPPPSAFSEPHKAWYWTYTDEEGPHQLFFDAGEKVRFCVEKIIFTPKKSAKTSQLIDGRLGQDSSSQPEIKTEPEPVYMSLHVHMIESGLGPPGWWS